MPELPEVQTIANDLTSLGGKKLAAFWTTHPKALKNEAKKSLTAEFLAKELSGKTLKSVRRHGKALVLELGSGSVLLLHLRMTGQLFWVDKKTAAFSPSLLLQKYPHLRHFWGFTDGSALLFADIRKFATITWLKDGDLPPAAPDPLEKSFTAGFFSKIIQKYPNRSIKELLMDGKLISGIGNIYANEALFAAHINPLRKSSSLSETEKRLILNKIKQILKKAIRMRGTSVSDYRDGAGQKGTYQNQLRIYRKRGLPCQVCGKIILRTVQGGRSTFYCPSCQK